MIYASDAEIGDALGWSVSTNGNTAAIAAPWTDSGSGSVYVVDRVADLSPDCNGNGVPDECDISESANWIRSPVNGHYYRLTVPMSNWPDAEAEAVRMGGHLATIRGSQEEDWIAATYRNTIAPYYSLWVGLYQSPSAQGDADPWFWTSGEPTTYLHWCASEPDGGIFENHAMFFLYSPPFSQCLADISVTQDPNIFALVERLTEPSTDCNSNGIPDECELAGSDCNHNGLIDSCEIGEGGVADCNENAIPDECEIAVKLSIYSMPLDDELPNRAISLNNLAALSQDRGRPKEAERLYREALALYRQLHGNEHPNVAISLNNLATLLQFQKRLTEAESNYREALAMYRKLHGEEHTDVARSKNNLAMLLQSEGKDTEAEPLFREALATHRNLRGNHHADVATDLNNLALLLRDQGRFAEAGPLFSEALAINRKLHGYR